MTMTTAEILSQLDRSATDYNFPMLDNGYAYPADVRLTAYRDDTRWALIIETVDQSPRGGGHDGTRCVIHVYGNCIEGIQGPVNEDFLSRTSDSPEGPIYSEECDWNLNESAGRIAVGDQLLSFDLSPAVLQRKGITPAEDGVLSSIDLLRSLLPEHRELFLATEQEKRRRIPSDLPEFMRLEEWHHPNLCAGELPSASETFQQLAEAIVTGDRSRYRPGNHPNTHWSNWPEGGTL
jgi:hypothetical protein